MRELDLQIKCAQYLTNKNILFYSVNNNASSQKHGNLLNLCGRKSGVPDLMVVENNEIYHTLAIELKAPKTARYSNLPSSAQLGWIEKLRKKNYFACWLNSFDAFIHLIETYRRRPKDLVSYLDEENYKYL